MKLFDISNIGVEVCNKYMNQDHADPIIPKDKSNAHKVQVFEDLIKKLKNNNNGSTINE